MVNRGISDDNGSQTRTEESYSVVLDLTNLYIEHGATQHQTALIPVRLIAKDEIKYYGFESDAGFCATYQA